MIALETVSFAYQAPQLALSEVTFEFNKGILGLIGPNGAGKTTLIKLLATLLKPQEGEIFVNELPITERTNIRKVIGYLPEHFTLYPTLTPRQIVRLLTQLYGCPLEESKKRALDALKKLNASQFLDRPIGKLSHGQQQRVGLAQAIAHEPSLLLLDEPLSGLDPFGRIEVKQFLQEFIAEGKTVLLSSHILMDLDEVCDRFAFLFKGKLQEYGDSTELAKRYGEKMCRMKLQDASAEVLEQIKAQTWVQSIESRGNIHHVHLTDLETAKKDLPQLLVKEGCIILEYAIADIDLDYLFRKTFES
ncbi:MAG: ABC transporter ATP-binding protein [Candidatus Hodarchaeota archaeon]